MTIVEDRLGTNPLHRVRNRTAARILESVWERNYEENKALMMGQERIPFKDLQARRGGSVALVVGAGPSLDENLADLRYLPLGSLTMFCCDKAFPKVSRITPPQVVTALNAENPAVEAWWKEARTMTNSVLLAPVTCDPRTFKAWKGPVCPVHISLPVTLSDRIAQETGEKGMMGGSNVGVFSYLMAAQLEYDNIILIGLDYSFRTREEALAKHRPGEQYMLWEGIGRKGEVRWTTWDWFDSAITFFEYARFVFRARGIRTFSCTGDGILYDGEFIEDCGLKEVMGLVER